MHRMHRAGASEPTEPGRRRRRTAASGVLLASLVLGAVGCGSTGQAADPTTSVPAPSADREPTTTAPVTITKPDRPRSSAPIAPSSSYDTLDALYAQITASGVVCGPLVDDNTPTGNPYEIPVDLPHLQGRCATGPGTALVFSIFEEKATRDDRVDELMDTTGSISTPDDPSYILVGENWLINVSRHKDQVDLLAEQLGGQVRTAPES